MSPSIGFIGGWRAARHDPSPRSTPLPYRPRTIALANRLGHELSRWGIGSGRINAEQVVRIARRRTGLHDFGDERFREALEVLVDSIERESRLTWTGRLIARARLVSTVGTRLRVHALLQAHPEILEQPIQAPIVIVGLQRTGTTMLHRLLASDPRLRSLASWEAIDPLPPGRGGAGGPRDPRPRRARLAERALRYMAPEFFAIHPVEADAPEEEVLLLEYALLSTVPEATLRVPGYARWLETQDHRPAYDYLAVLLKILQWSRPDGQRWLLKTPHHMEHLDSLRDVFPDATIVQTHRDPLRTLASFCSMVSHGRGVFSDRVDPHEVGAAWSKKVVHMVGRAMKERQRLGETGFVDVSYYDLIEDPIPEARRILHAAGLDWQPGTERLLTESRRRNPQNKHGKHRYRLEDFGLCRSELEPLFEAYRARFSIRQEG